MAGRLVLLVHDWFPHTTRLHVVTSPNIEGFCVTAETAEEAEREARALLNLICTTGIRPAPCLTAKDFEGRL